MGLFSGISLSSIVSQGVQEGLQASSVAPSYLSGVSQIGTATVKQSVVSSINPLNTGATQLSNLNDPTKSYNVLRYPLEVLGNSLENPPHAVMFYVNQPITSHYEPANNGAVSNATKNAAFVSKSLNTTGSALSGVNVDTSSLTGAATSIVSSVADVAQHIVAATSASKLQPSTVRIKQAIALYMPDTVVAGFQHNWDTVSLTNQLGSVGTAAFAIAGISDLLNSGSLSDFAKTSNWRQVPEAIANSLSTPQELEAAGAVLNRLTGSSDWGAIVAGSKGYAVNPQIEMLYRGTANRQFIFEFKFQPRSSAEALQINGIIKAFKQYAAPTLITGDQSFGGRYFIPPCQFDIEFLFANSPNANLPKISTCVLEDIQVNYSESGQFATYSDGMPVSIGMQLRFKEVDIIYSQLIDQMGY
jgi:Tail-tube assembly protein